jgi:hypothetical protein
VDAVLYWRRLRRILGHHVRRADPHKGVALRANDLVPDLDHPPAKIDIGPTLVILGRPQTRKVSMFIGRFPNCG